VGAGEGELTSKKKAKRPGKGMDRRGGGAKNSAVKR